MNGTRVQRTAAGTSRAAHLVRADRPSSASRACRGRHASHTPCPRDGCRSPVLVAHSRVPVNESVLSRNNVNVFGEGTQPMLFAHGFGCDQNMWRFVTPAFADDYKIVLFDYVGAGKSDVSAYDRNKYRNLNGYAQDVLDVCQALELENVIFVGHSVSSMVGVLAAI